MKVLLVQTSFLGDTILSTPLIAAIKQIYPEAELWMLTTRLSMQLVERDPLLSGVLTFDKNGKEKGLRGLMSKIRELRQHKFDRVYSLHRSYRTALLLYFAGIPERIGFTKAACAFLYTHSVKRYTEVHDVLRNLSLLSTEQSFLASGKKIEQFFPTDLRLYGTEPGIVEEKFGKVLKPPLAVLVPGSAWKTKMWHWQGYRETAKHLLERGYNVVLLGAASESATCSDVAANLPVQDLSGKTTLSESISIMKMSSLVVCNDSMSLHMASALKIPNVAVFCATSPAFGFGPWKNNALVVEKEDLSCKPCRRHGSNVCPTGTEACMRDLPASAIIEAIGKVESAGRDKT